MTRLRDAFQYQAKSCDALGSPFMSQLCRLLGDRLEPGTPLRDRLFEWDGDLGPAGDSVPLRVCGALHALRLGGDATLGAAYPPNAASDDVLWDAVAGSMDQHASAIARFIDSPPQTNEVRRAAALIAAAHVITRYVPLPLRLSEVGASAGLNLNFDQFALEADGTRFGPDDSALTLTPKWTGNLPPNATPRVVERRGVDLNPVTDAQRLRAYLWPDQPHRQALTDAALALPAAPVDRGDAIDWLATRLPHVAGQTHMIYSTVAWQYFPAQKQADGFAMIQAAGATATQNTPLAFVQMENDRTGDGAALTLRLWPNDLHLTLGRVDFHGRWIRWNG